MLPAPRAILPQLDAVRRVAPVLTAVVVPALTLLTCQRYQLSHKILQITGVRRTTPPPLRKVALLDYLCYDASPYGPAPLADGEVQPLVHGDRRDQLHVHHRVVPRHHHLYPLLQPYLPRHVRRPEVKLRTVVAEERRVPSSLFFGEDVHFGLELGVRGYRARLCQNLSALYVVALYSS